MIDFLVLILLGVNIYFGLRRGLVIGLIDLGSLFFALAIGSIGYPIFGWILRIILRLPGVFGDLLGFVIVALGLIELISILSHKYKLPDRLRVSGAVNKLAGGLIGAFIGTIMAGFISLLLGVTPGGSKGVDNSALGSGFVKIAPVFYQELESIGIDPPKLLILAPRYEDELGSRVVIKPQFRRINFTKLAGATCIACGGKVKFLGYQRKVGGSLLAPKFQCTRCGRTSDGCQTFEGFHKIYKECPVEAAKRNILFNCGVWTNPNFVQLRGTCPVCGKAHSL